jgi:threonine aldolase
MTVGPGITPGLLTLSPTSPKRVVAKRSRAMRIARNYRRWGVAPRPENVFAAIKFGGAAFLTHISYMRIGAFR